MRGISRAARAFGSDETGAVAIIFALTAYVALLMVGIAIDYGRGLSLKTSLQATADSAAINGAIAGESGATLQLTGVAADTGRRGGAFGVKSPVLVGEWINATDYEVAITASMPTTFLAAIPGMPTEITVAAYSIARGYRLKVVADPPTKSDISYEAGDYNQIWVYCYDPSWQRNGTRASKSGTAFNTTSGNLKFTKNLALQENRYGRSDFTLISDNGGNTFPFSMPQCKEGESISYMLFNSRNNRTSPSNWGKNYTSCGTALSQTGKTCYEWFTDTTYAAGGVEKYGVSPYQVETVLCDDAQCSKLTAGGYIPANHSVNRVPQSATQKCEPGKFMYFGWEDRPPQNTGGNGAGAPLAAGASDSGGDRDYDDIRLIVSCPRMEVDVQSARLLQ